MGFSDLLSSSRGPGIIGTLVALVVLGGFGLLFFFVFDEGMQGKDISIESYIRKNDEEIASSKRQLASRETEYLVNDQRAADNQEANKLAAANALAAKQLAELQLDRDEADKKVEAAQAALDSYKDSYRTAERKGAAGETMPELKLLNGITYTDVSITLVDNVGMQIRHSGGVKRIPYQDLPEAMQDRFQFDLGQMTREKEKEKIEDDNHKDQVKLSDLRTKLGTQKKQLADLKSQIETDRKTIKEINLNSAGQKEALNRFRGKIREEEAKPVSHAPQMRIELQRMEANYNAVLASVGPKEQAIKNAESKIPGLMADIDRTNKDIKDEIAHPSAAPQ
jgi:chromosome segregation ATPase